MVQFQDELASRHEQGGCAYGLALDASKAFPSLKRSALSHIARRVGFPAQLWNALQAHYDQGDTVWRLAGQWVGEESLHLRVGLSQGCPLSVVLYNLYMLPLVLELARRDVLVLAYADDLTLVADSQVALGDAVALVVDYLSEGSISLNIKKCQYFATHGDDRPLVVEG
eukprot:5142908-Amphidinium_carterae.1